MARTIIVPKIKVQVSFDKIVKASSLYKVDNVLDMHRLCMSIFNKDTFNWTAHSIIFVHNHPSRNPNPSKTDIDAFNKIHRAGRLLDIDVLDSLVITNKTIFSIKKNLKIDL